MRLGIMQPYIFPYIGYFQLITAVDKFVFLDDVNFINKGWINRNNLLVNNKASLFTIPLKGASQNKLISEIFTADEKWILKILKTIETSYKRAPQFLSVYPIISQVFTSSQESIAKLTKESIKVVSNYLEITTEFVDSSSIYDNKHLKGEERIIDINKKEQSSYYINPLGGKDLYCSEKFKKENITLKFLKPLVIEYNQQRKEFVPWLSIIDVLMWCTKEEVKELLEKYELE
jgi:hypothetical protein